MLTNTNKYPQMPTNAYKCPQMRTRAIELSIYLARMVENTKIRSKLDKNSHKIAKLGPEYPIYVYIGHLYLSERVVELQIYPKWLHILKFVKT